MYGQGPWLSSLVWLAVPEQTKHMTDMDNKCTCSLVATKILLLCTDPIPLLFLLKICLSLKEPFLQASVVWWATFRVCMRSTLMIFAISICAHAHAWWAHGQRIWTRHTRTHTYIHTYIHKYSDFLVWVIYVRLASARPDYSYNTLIGMHEMLGWMHSNCSLVAVLLAHDPLSSSAYNMITHTPLVAGNLPIKTGC